MKSQTVVLIVSHSAQIRDSLLVLLRSIKRIDTIYQAEDSPSALGIRPEIQPVLILLDHDQPDNELRTTLGQIKAAWPQARCVVFLDDEEDRRRVKDAGADVVLVKGLRAATVLETIEKLLFEDDPSLGASDGGRK